MILFYLFFLQYTDICSLIVTYDHLKKKYLERDNLYSLFWHSTYLINEIHSLREFEMNYAMIMLLLLYVVF